MIQSGRNGIGNRMTGEAEMHERREILKGFVDRARKRIPGTHSLGKDFQTVDPEKREAK